MTEKFEDIKMKYVILETWKNKLGYPLNYKDIEELENIIDYYKQESEQPKERIAHKHKYAMEIEDKYVEVKAIMDELEKWLEKMLDCEEDFYSVVRVADVLSKIKKLKGESNEI